jgi:hypothetical protein
MIDAPNVRAALDARFALAFVHLPESFKGFAVRKTVWVFQVDSGGGAVRDSFGQYVEDGLVQTLDSACGKSRGSLEGIHSRAEQGFGGVDVAQTQNPRLIQQQRFQCAA